jgi:hypothetical protein
MAEQIRGSAQRGVGATPAPNARFAEQIVCKCDGGTAVLGDAVRVFRQLARLEVGSVKARCLIPPTRPHQGAPQGCYATGTP